MENPNKPQVSQGSSVHPLKLPGKPTPCCLMTWSNLKCNTAVSRLQCWMSVQELRGRGSTKHSLFLVSPCYFTSKAKPGLRITSMQQKVCMWPKPLTLLPVPVSSFVWCVLGHARLPRTNQADVPFWTHMDSLCKEKITEVEIKLVGIDLI